MITVKTKLADVLAKIPTSQFGGKDAAAFLKPLKRTEVSNQIKYQV